MSTDKSTLTQVPSQVSNHFAHLFSSSCRCVETPLSSIVSQSKQNLRNHEFRVPKNIVEVHSMCTQNEVQDSPCCRNLAKYVGIVHCPFTPRERHRCRRVRPRCPTCCSILCHALCRRKPSTSSVQLQHAPNVRFHQDDIGSTHFSSGSEVLLCLCETLALSCGLQR